MSVLTKIKEIEKKKIHFGCHSSGMMSAQTSQSIGSGLGFSTMQPNIFGGYSIYNDGVMKGSVNPSITGGFTVTDDLGQIEESWMSNGIGGFTKF